MHAKFDFDRFNHFLEIQKTKMLVDSTSHLQYSVKIVLALNTTNSLIYTNAYDELCCNARNKRQSKYSSTFLCRNANTLLNIESIGQG